METFIEKSNTDNSIINWKYQINEIVQDKFIIIDKKIRKRVRIDKKDFSYIANEKMYRVKCLKCNYISDWCREDSIKNKGCLSCSNRTLIRGKNDLATTNPELFNLVVNPLDMFKYQKGSHAWIDIKCPFCQTVTSTFISNLVNDKFVCQFCKDGISTCEKYFMNILKQLKITYKFQLSKKTFKWCEDYRYDFYIPAIKTIIELNGSYHYKNVYYSDFNKTQLNDENKRKLAIRQNEVEHYITINFKQKNYQFYKEAICNCKEIYPFIDIHKIDFDEAWNYSRTSFIKFSCEYWNEGKGTLEISNILQVDKITCAKYLNKCNEKNLLTVPYSKKECTRRNNKYRSIYGQR